MKIFRIRRLTTPSLGISLIFLFTTVASVVRADDELTKNDQNTLKRCIEEIEKVCGQKPILLPGKVSTYPSCVSKSIENIDGNCETLLTRELEKNPSSMASTPKISK